MNTPTFFEGVGIALIGATIGSIIFTATPTIGGEQFSLKITITMICLGYLGYLLRRSQERVGRIVISLSWVIMSIILWAWNPDFLSFCLINTAMIWITRSLYFHNGILISLADLGLVLFGFAAAFWAILNTQSLFLATWCFFLIQALFPTLIAILPNRITKNDKNLQKPDHFESAFRVADSAIQKISTSKQPS